MIDWNSQETEVLLNPKIPPQVQEEYNKPLLKKNLPSHLWITTSGTTGKFKCVALSKPAILSSAEAVNRHFSVSQSDVWINVLPTFHVGGLGILARGYLSGAKVVSLEKKWDPHQFVKDLNSFKGTLSALVPTQVHDLVSLNLQAPKSLRAVIVGGGVLKETTCQKALALGWPLYPSYGMTECASQIATADRPGSLLGKILAHHQVKIHPEGFIQIKSPSLLTLYAHFNNGKVTFEDPKQNGWFKTEDLGEIINTNYLKVLGRSRDFLKVGGESVSLQTCQRQWDHFQEKHRINQEMLLSAQTDDRLGQKVVLVVEGDLTEPIHSLIQDYNDNVLPFERVQDVISKEKIPRNEMGKPILTSGKEILSP